MELLGASTQLFVLLGLVTGVLLYLWIPYMVWSITRNIRQIRIQFERLNDTLESRGGVKIGTLGL